MGLAPENARADRARRRADGLVVPASLLPITLVPATAALLGDHPSTPLALVIFALNVIGITCHRPPSCGGTPAGTGRSTTILIPGSSSASAGVCGSSPSCFAISIAMAPISVPLTYLAWTATFVLVFTTDWLSWQPSRPHDRGDDFRATARRGPRCGYAAMAASCTLTPARTLQTLLDGARSGAVSSGGRPDQATRPRFRLASHGRSAMLNLRYPWAWGAVSLLVPGHRAHAGRSRSAGGRRLERAGDPQPRAPAHHSTRSGSRHWRGLCHCAGDRRPDDDQYPWPHGGNRAQDARHGRSASITVAGGLAAVQVEPRALPGGRTEQIPLARLRHRCQPGRHRSRGVERPAPSGRSERWRRFASSRRR